MSAAQPGDRQEDLPFVGFRGPGFVRQMPVEVGHDCFRLAGAGSRRFAEPLAALDAEFPGLAPREYRGEPGRALDHIEEQLAAIVRIEEEMELVRAELPAVEADAALEARQRRGKWVLLGLLAGIVLLVVIGQGLL